MKRLIVKNKFQSFFQKIYSWREIFGFSFGAILLFAISFILKFNMVLPAFLLCMAVFMKFFYNSPQKKNYKLLYPFFLFIILIFTTYFLRDKKIPLFFMPFCAFPMLTTILFGDLILSIIFTICAAISVATISYNNFSLGLILLTVGIISCFLTLDVRKRNPLIKAGILTGIIQIILLFLIKGFHLPLNWEYILLFLSGIIVIGVLPLFEYIFNTITNISLLELADFNHELLNRLMLEAPGTYHHSLIVGNLSEAACKAIGANALLARIGAYYHDIGKLHKPEYFSENQNISSNKHDELSPSMSKMVIMNHIKEGIDLGKTHHLNPRILAFVQQHHGTSLVYYFYRRALEKSEDTQEISEEVFRYPGPKPESKETAIVLLADSVEAATRAMKDPTPDKIKESVHKIINNKFIDGQLDDCEITLKDLETTAKVFMHILTGMYHTRITYPEVKSGQNLDKKPAKENQTQSKEDKKDSR